jgi:pimeloyl-ACP methyl ester carboxylesterase
MKNFVIIHGAWHTGELFEATAGPIRAQGHKVYLPTLAGNRPGQKKDEIGLEEAVQSMLDYFETERIDKAVLVGHSYAGMIITALADRIPEKIDRLVYWNAFVPNDGEAINDMVPPHYAELFDQLEEEDGTVTLPFPIWREAFINDGSMQLAMSSYAQLNPHPYKTFTDKASLSKNPVDIQLGKSYINCTKDTSMPQSLGWHPRLSEKLGLFRLLQCSGGHELCFKNPDLLAEKIIEAGQD